MEAYWPQQLADMYNDYPHLEKRIEEYRRDNDVLNRIYSQNLELKKLLDQAREAKGAA